jgi:hypothetical protein
MTIQNLWEKFIYIFRCFLPKRKTEYIQNREDVISEYITLTEPNGFVIIDRD